MSLPKQKNMQSRAVYASMRKLRGDGNFQVLQSQWMNDMELVLQRGMKDKNPENWAYLEGFRFAVGTIDRLLRKTVDRSDEESTHPTEDMET